MDEFNVKFLRELAAQQHEAATTIRGFATKVARADYRDECLLLADRYEELAQSTESFAAALSATRLHLKN
jgi:hypothetical protein